MKTNPSRQHADLAIRTLPLMVAMAFNPALAQVAASALPSGGQIVAGQGALQQTGNTLNVLQTSQQMIANWQSFNIGQQATVNFIQPGSNALVLNRVIGSDPSQIFGQMRANGQVMLINPNGILFGAGAQINVGALMASTHALSNEDFLSGKFRLTDGAQAVRNAGSISAAEGGYVLLAGAQVDNSGHIQANGGTVALAAGKDLSVTVGQTGLLKVKVDTAAAQASIDNAGALVADGGHVLLTARQAAPLAAVAINQQGIVRANSVQQRQGEIWIDGGNGSVLLAGQTQAAADAGQGGRVVATGADVTVQGKVDVSGSQGGGAVYLGGGWQGKDPAIAEAGKVTVAQGASVAANALQAGQGGTVVAWSAEATRIQGSIEARGAGNGNGGQVETSSRGVLGVSGSVNASASGSGQGGSWLLDPTNLTVVGGSTGTSWSTANGQSGDVNNVLASSIEASLNAGSGVTLQASDNITIQSDISKTAGGNASLSLEAGNNILLDTGADISSTVGKLDVTFGKSSDTQGVATLKGTVNSNGGNVTFHKEAVLAHATPISTKITEVSSAASGNITFNKDVKLAAQGYSVALNAQGAQNGGVYTGKGGDIVFNASVLTATPDVVPQSPQALSLDNTGRTAGDITLGGAATDRIGGSGSAALRSLTLAGDADIALKAGTVNLLNSSGDVLTASNTLGTTTTLTLAADTVINVGGGSIPGLSTGYTDYRQQTFNIKGQSQSLTINAARSIKVKNTEIDVKTLALNAFADSGAGAGAVVLDNATLKTRGDLTIGKDGGFATGYGADADGITDGVRISNTVINTKADAAQAAGKLLIRGQAPTGSSAGAGIKITGARTDISTAEGNLTLQGKVANQASSGNKDGVILGEDGASRVTLQTSSGKLVIEGDASSLTTTPTGGTRYDGVIISSKALIKTDSGDIQITGKGGGGSHAFLTENHGIRIEDTDTSIVSGSGDITLSGTSGGKTSATGGENSFGIYAKGQTMYLGTSSVADGVSASGVITVEADSLQFVNSSDFHLKAASSGELRVRPLTASRNIDISSAGAVDKLYLGSDWFNGSSRAVFQPGFGGGNAANPGVTIGRTDGSGSLTVSNATTLRDNTALLMGGSGGKVLINAALTVKASDAAQSRQLTLDVAGGATGNGVINTNTLLLNGRGDVVLGGANLVDTLSANLGDRLDYNNAKSLTIGQGSYSRTDDPLAANLSANTRTTTSTDGIVTSNDAVNISLSAGDLSVARSVNAGTATLALTTQAGGISEQASATLTADKLAISSQGSVTLDNSNQINVLSANVSGSGSDLKFSNGKSLLLDRVAVTPLGADSSGSVTAGSTQQRDGVSVAGMTRLNLSSGNLSQSATAGQGRVTSSSLKLTLPAGSVSLDDSSNDIGTLAATLSGTGQTLSVKDKNGLLVGTVDGSNGVQTSNGNIALAASADAASSSGDLQLAQQVNAGSADVRLSAGKGGINETASSGLITANELRLTAQDTSTLDSNNAIDEVTASISGSGQGVRLTNTRSLVVGDLDSQTGISASGDVRLTLAAGNASVRNLTQTQDIKAGGLNVASDTGDVTLERTSNEIGKLAARLDGAGKALKLKDKDGIEVASVDGRSGLLTNGGNIHLAAAADAASTSGDLQLNADVSTGGSQGVARLSSQRGKVAGSGKLTAQALLAQSVTGVSLDNKLNNVATVAGSVSGNGAFLYKDVDTLEVGTVADAANVPVSGIRTQNGNVQLSVAEDDTAAAGNLNLTQSVTAGGSGSSMALQAYKGKVTETANVSLVASQLQLRARDTTELTNPDSGSGVHQIDTVAATITGDGQHLTFLNSQALTVGSVTAHDSQQALQGVSTANGGHIALATASGKLQLDNNVTAGAAGSIDLRAGGAAGDIVFNGGQARSGSATVQLVAGRDIGTTTSNGQVNEIRTTGDVLLQAAGSIGSDGKRIELADADKLALRAGSDVWLHKTQQAGSADLKVDSVAATTYRGGSFGGSAGAQSGMVADGNIALNVASGQLAINQDIRASQGGSIDLRTGGSGKDIVFAAGAGVESRGSSGDRRVQLIASGSILAQGADADSNDEIRTSGNVLLAAGGQIGASGQRVETRDVATLATESGGEQWLRQSRGDLTIGSVAALTPADNALTRTAANLAGMTSKQGNSGLYQDVVAGSLVVDKTVSASGSGAVDLRASGSMTQQSGSQVKSQSGNLLLSTGGSFTATDSSQGVQTVSTAGGSLVIEANGAIDLSQGKLQTSGGAGVAGGEIYLHNHAASGDITLGQQVASQGGSQAAGGVVTVRNQGGAIRANSTVDVSRGQNGSSDGAIQLQAQGDIVQGSGGVLIGDANGQLAARSAQGRIALTASGNGGNQMARVALQTQAVSGLASIDYRDRTALEIGDAGGQGSSLAGPQAQPASQVAAVSGVRTQAGANSGVITVDAGGDLLVSRAVSSQVGNGSGARINLRSDGAITTRAGISSDGSINGGDILLSRTSTTAADIRIEAAVSSQGAQGGTITVNNPAGRVQVDGEVNANGSNRGGSIQLAATGDIGQTAALKANGGGSGSLKVRSGGQVTLDNSGNNVDTVAAALSGSNKGFTYLDSDTVLVGTVAEAENQAQTSGLQTRGGDVAVRTLSGDLLVQQAVGSLGGKVALDAARDAQLSAGVSSGGGKVTLQTGRDARLQSSVTSNGGDVQLTVTRDLQQDGSVSTGGGAAQWQAGGQLAQNGSVQTAGGAVNWQAGALLGQSGTLQTAGGAVNWQASGQISHSGSSDTAGGNSQWRAGSDIVNSGTVSTAAGSQSWQAGGDIRHSGSQRATSGAVGWTASGAIVNDGSLQTSSGNVQWQAGTRLQHNGSVQTAGASADWQAGRDLTLNGNLATDGGLAKLRAGGNLQQQAGNLETGIARAELTAGGAITQSGNGYIQAGSLALLAVNSSTLTQANRIGTLAATVSQGGLALRNAQQLTVGQAGTLSGVTTAGAQQLNVDGGDINIARSMQANGGGLSVVGGSGAIKVNAAVSASGGDVLLRSTDGAISVNAAINALGQRATLQAGGSGQLALAANVTADTVLLDAAQDILQQSGSVRADAGLTAKAGRDLQQNGSLSAGQLGFDVGRDILQLGGGSLSARQTELKAGGSARLEGSHNLAGVLAARTGGQLRYQDAGDLVVGSAGGTQGVQAGGTLWVRAKGNVTLAQGVSAQGTGNKALVLVADKRIVNQAGANALQAPNGRWLAYDDNPLLLDNGLGGFAFRRLATHYSRYGEDLVVEAGNGYLTTAVVGFTEQYSRLNGGATEGADSGVSVALAGGATRNRALEVPVQQPAASFARVISRPSLANPALRNGPAIQSLLPMLLPLQPGRDFVAAFRDLVGEATIESVRMADGSELPDWLLVNSSAQTLSGNLPRELNAPVRLVVRVMDAGSSDIYPLELTLLPRSNLAGVGYR